MSCVISGLKSAVEFQMWHVVRWNALAVTETIILGQKGSKIWHQFGKMVNLHARYFSQAMDSAYFFLFFSILFTTVIRLKTLIESQFHN